DEGIFGLREDVDQNCLVEVVERGDDRKTANEFRDQAELQEIFRLKILQDFPGLALVRPPHLRAKADRGALSALGDDFLQPGKGAPTDKQDVGGVDLEEFLLRMLAATLWRHRRDRAFHDLE